MKTTLKLRKGIDLAAMVDIVFLLIAYFLINATLIKNPAIKIQLPKSETAQTESPNNIIIYINNENKVFLNETPATIEDLPKLLQNINKEEEHVIIKADQKTNYQTLISVLDHVNKAGVTHFNLATEKQP